MFTPRITVIIPARNEAHYILDPLDSLRSQDYAGIYDVIVVDNGSTDRTVQIAVGLGAQVVRETRAGVQFARERGRREAKGQILAYLDADCIPPRDWLKQGVSPFIHREVVGVSGPCDFYDARTGARLLLNFLHKNAFPCLHYLIHEILHAGGLMIGGNSFLRADKMEEIGGFDTNIVFYGDDTDTARRLAKTGRLIFKRDLMVKSSARRFERQGYMKVTHKYFSNFFWVLVFKKPFHR